MTLHSDYATLVVVLPCSGNWKPKRKKLRSQIGESEWNKSKFSGTKPKRFPSKQARKVIQREASWSRRAASLFAQSMGEGHKSWIIEFFLYKYSFVSFKLFIRKMSYSCCYFPPIFFSLRLHDYSFSYHRKQNKQSDISVMNWASFTDFLV